MSEIISVEPPPGTQKRIGIPAEQPAAALEALKKLFAGMPNVVSARLGLMELVYPDGRSIMSYTIGIECRANRDWIEQKTVEALKSAPAGRWPISLVPPTATYFAEQAIVFFRARIANPASGAANASAGATGVKPSIDVNIPVENPDLVEAMNRVVRDGSDAAKDALLIELQRATYLAIILSDGINTKPGQSVLRKGRRFRMITLQKQGTGGGHVLPLFSDWTAIKAHTDRKVTGFILPAPDAWTFALESGIYSGVVINPAHNALPLDPGMLRYLLANSAGT